MQAEKVFMGVVTICVGLFGIFLFYKSGYVRSETWRKTPPLSLVRRLAPQEIDSYVKLRFVTSIIIVILGVLLLFRGLNVF
ncbi:hypothetical protein AAIR98_000196 [Elusimicrobium simillimum]|uniref:hypothetical protein n=1 Tax=Elusimicrobium simillimum TaxID=3143438 RepID=UPI003C6F90BB